MKRWFYRPDPLIDTLIGTPQYRDGFELADDSLRVQSLARREHAERVRRDAARIDTRDDSRSKIHRVS